MQLIFANNAQTTLAGSISDTALMANLAAGTGVLFPTPTPSVSYFVGTFTDAATGLLHEIVWVTALSGDTITMVRGQEGTDALPWSANDLFAELWTAGQCAAMLQAGEFQAQSENYALDTGSANTYLAALDPALTSYTPGLPVRVKIANTNTGDSTLNVNAVGAVHVHLRNGQTLKGGELQAGGVAEFFYDGTYWQTDGALAVLSAAPLNVSGAVSLTAATAGRTLNASAAAALTVPQSTTLWPGWGFQYIAAGGAVTIDPNAADTIYVNGVSQTMGVSYVIAEGNWGFLATDGAGSLLLAVGNSASLANLVYTNVTNVFTAAQGGPIGALSDGASIAWNAKTAQSATVTIAGNRTLAAPSNLVAGFTYVLKVTQGAGGSHTLAYNAIFKFPGGTVPVLTTGAGDYDILTFWYDGTYMNAVPQYNFQ